MLALLLIVFQLDNLSREDLVKFVKRQIVTVQKLKAHNDGKRKEIMTKPFFVIMCKQHPHSQISAFFIRRQETDSHGVETQDSQ